MNKLLLLKKPNPILKTSHPPNRQPGSGALVWERAPHATPDADLPLFLCCEHQMCFHSAFNTLDAQATFQVLANCLPSAVWLPPTPGCQSVTAGATNDFPLPSLDGRFQPASPMLAWQYQILETRPPRVSLTWVTLPHLSGTPFFKKSLKSSHPQAVSMHLVRVSPKLFH